MCYFRICVPVPIMWGDYVLKTWTCNRFGENQHLLEGKRFWKVGWSSTNTSHSIDGAGGTWGLPKVTKQLNSFLWVNQFLCIARKVTVVGPSFPLILYCPDGVFPIQSSRRICSFDKMGGIIMIFVARINAWILLRSQWLCGKGWIRLIQCC